MKECKVCGNWRYADDLDEGSICWVCCIKRVDKIMDDREEKDTPKPFLFDSYLILDVRDSPDD